jgi:hypothetical protein
MFSGDITASDSHSASAENQSSSYFASAFCDVKNSQLDLSDKTITEVRKASSIVVEAWRACMAGRAVDAPKGILMSVVYTADPMVFEIAYSFNRPDFAQPYATVESTNISLGASSEYGCSDAPKPKDQIDRLKYMHCTRDPYVDGHVEIKAELGDTVRVPLKQIPRPWEPIDDVDLTGTFRAGKEQQWDFNVRQVGKNVTWDLVADAWRHSFEGRFVDPSTISGTQLRVATVDGTNYERGCTVVQRYNIAVKKIGDKRSIVAQGVVIGYLPPEKPCDLRIGEDTSFTADY